MTFVALGILAWVFVQARKKLKDFKRKQLERLVAIAQSMGASIIADGVKSKDDEKALLETGVEYGQGLIYGASVPL